MLFHGLHGSMKKKKCGTLRQRLERDGEICFECFEVMRECGEKGRCAFYGDLGLGPLGGN